MKNVKCIIASCLLLLIAASSGAQFPEPLHTGARTDYISSKGSAVAVDTPDQVLAAADKITGHKPAKTESRNIMVISSPKGDQITIDFDEELTLTTLVDLFDISGKIVSAERLRTNTSTHTVNLSALEEGIYLLEIRNAEYCVTRKLVKAE
jgi:hypothetical protein